MVETLMAENSKIYVMINKNNGVTVECTEKYLIQWLARGFEVLEIKGDSIEQGIAQL